MSVAVKVVGTPERRGSHHWWVPSGMVGYTVEQVQERDGRWRWRCCCPAFRWKHTKHGQKTLCKHIQACLEALRGKEVSMGE
jgi:hypothetical protein